MPCLEQSLEDLRKLSDPVDDERGGNMAPERVSGTS
jgi:hypothetical protein